MIQRGFARGRFVRWQGVANVVWLFHMSELQRSPAGKTARAQRVGLNEIVLNY